MHDDVTKILVAIERGDRHAASQLLPLVYDELKRLAAARMQRESPDNTLQPTALVHEAYLRLVHKGDELQWDSRGHFFAAAAESMRRILIDHARRRNSIKRGGGLARYEIREGDAVTNSFNDLELMALDDALEKLAAVDPQLVRLVELRFFTGLTIDQTAKILDCSARTAKRNWAYARAWLRREMGEQ